MIYIISQVNGCSYTLDPVHNVVLYYHPIYSDGSCETNFDAYAEVEWEFLEDDALAEADRCDKLLKGNVQCRV